MKSANAVYLGLPDTVAWTRVSGESISKLFAKLDTVREGMVPRGLSNLVYKATLLAEQARTSEIGIDLLLAALDAPEVDPASLSWYDWIAIRTST